MKQHARFRTRPKLINVFSVAFVLSLLFHLSMLTVFNVVAVFPVPKIDFYTIDIVQSALRPVGNVAASDLTLDDINLDSAKLNISGLNDEMELPTIEFAELERLRVRQAKIDNESLYASLYADSPDDTWGLFAGGLQRLGQSISDVTLGTLLGGESAPELSPEPSLRPAEGFLGFIEWNDSTKARKLLFSPPIKALWNLPPSTLGEDIEIVFEVNGEGRIVNVYSPSVENQDLVDAIQLGVLQYRFEPLPIASAANQLGTLRIMEDR